MWGFVCAFFPKEGKGKKKTKNQNKPPPPPQLSREIIQLPTMHSGCFKQGC